MMKKGINIWSFPQGTIKENLALAKKAGFEGVELALGGEGELSLQSTEAEITEIRKTAEDSFDELEKIKDEIKSYFTDSDSEMM